VAGPLADVVRRIADEVPLVRGKGHESSSVSGRALAAFSLKKHRFSTSGSTVRNVSDGLNKSFLSIVVKRNQAAYR
jgi:hypothetical protein